MPSTRWLGHNFGFSSDVCVFQGCLDAMAGSVLLVVAAISVSFTDGHMERLGTCGKGGPLYAISFLTVCGLWMVMSAFLMYYSSKGSPYQSEKRIIVPTILSLRFFLVLLFMVNNIAGITWAISSNSDSGERCKNFGHTGVVLLTALVILQTFFSMYHLFWFFVLFCCRLSRHDGSKGGYSRSVRAESETLLLGEGGSDGAGRLKSAAYYSTICRRVCSFCVDSAGLSLAYDSVGRTLATFFEGFDLTSDDVALGLWLVQVDQKAKERKHIERLLDSSAAEIQDLEKRSKAKLTFQSQGERRQFLANDFEWDDAVVLSDMQYYYKYAMGIYGDLLFMYANLSECGPCNIYCCSNACNCFAAGNRFVSPRSCIGKTCPNCVRRFGAQFAGMKKTIGIDDDDSILYVSFKNSLLHSPFAVLVDHRKQCVVITIRGTLSLDDCVKDVMAEDIPMDTIGQEWGFDGEGQYCHRGVYNTALAIVQTIQRKGLLPLNIFADKGWSMGNASSKNFAMESVGEAYSVVVVGHSLGAGIGAMVSLLLRSKVKSLRAFFYSPPPIFSAGMVEQTKKFAFSVTLGTDLIARFSPQNMYRLRTLVVDAVQSSPAPKYKIMLGGACGCIDKVVPSAERGSSLAQEDVSIDIDEREGRDKQDRTSEGMDSLRNMYLPGNCLHIAQTVRTRTQCSRACNFLSGICCDVPRKFELQWVVDNTEAFQEILVDATMVGDHFPDVLAKNLKRMHDMYCSGVTSSV
jgi:sn1-specific diacylglycerol lipase